MYTATTVSISDATLDLSLTAVLTGEIVECMVMAMDVNGATGNDSATVSVINTSPTFSSVASISPSIGVYTGTALTCSATASDPDDGMITPTYEWSVGLVSIGMGSSYTVSALDTNVGDSITCTATATDSDNESTTSAASVSVQNTDPVLVSTSISVSTGYNDDIFSCSSSATDPDELLSISYAWMVDGVLVGSGSSLDLATTSAIPNDVVTCTASVTDSQGATDDDSVNTAILNRFPDTPTIFVTPSNPQAGVDDLFCQMGTLSDPDGSNQVLTESYEWVSSTGVTITGDTVLAQNININETWTCYGTVSDGIDDVVVDASVNSNVSNCPAASVGQTSVGHSNLGYCWYMTLPNGTCDATCGSVGGGSNLMTEAQSLISSNDVNYTDAQETMIHWFYVNGNPANFTGPGSGSWPGLGYGYLNGSYYNRVSGMNSAAFPGNTRGTDADRIFVCACTHDN
jgi:hypothetical protein